MSPSGGARPVADLVDREVADLLRSRLAKLPPQHRRARCSRDEALTRALGQLKRSRASIPSSCAEPFSAWWLSAVRTFDRQVVQLQSARATPCLPRDAYTFIRDRLTDLMDLSLERGLRSRMIPNARGFGPRARVAIERLRAELDARTIELERLDDLDDERRGAILALIAFLHERAPRGAHRPRDDQKIHALALARMARIRFGLKLGTAMRLVAICAWSSGVEIKARERTNGERAWIARYVRDLERHNVSLESARERGIPY